MLEKIKQAYKIKSSLLNQYLFWIEWNIIYIIPLYKKNLNSNVNCLNLTNFFLGQYTLNDGHLFLKKN
jgi:hypothetical protein